MTTYIYPKNLKAAANLWLWSFRDFTTICIATLLSALIMAQTGFLVPLALTAGYAFLSIRMEDTTVLEYMKYAVRYLISTQQYFEWRRTA